MAPRPSKKPKRKRQQEGSKKAAPRAACPHPLEGETRAAYAALCAYLEAGPDRTLRGVFPKNTNAWRWSSAYDWQARAAAYDDARRSERLAALTLAQREADLATQERDHGLRRVAGKHLVDEAVLANLRELAVTRDASAIQAIKLLYQLSGVEDLRRLRLTQAAREAALIEAAADPAVVAALARATPEQLAALRATPAAPPPDEYAAEEAAAADDGEGQ